MRGQCRQRLSSDGELVGLVVKNGIVLIDYAHRLRDEGHPFTDALEIAGRVRLRPILMTTLCTLFGLLPLALGFGAGAELQRPQALPWLPMRSSLVSPTHR